MLSETYYNAVRIFRHRIGVSIVLTGLLLFPAYNALCQRYNLTVYNTSNGLPGNQINCVTQDRFGRLWIGTMNGLAVFDGTKFTMFDQNNPISKNPVRSIFEDSKGNIWVGMVRKGVCKLTATTFEFYTSANGLLSDNVNAITEDLKGNIWIGTSEGLNRYDGRFFHSYTTLRGLVSNRVTSVKSDSRGMLWVATAEGVSRYDGSRFLNFTTESGLPSNICYHIAEDEQGNIWISTYLGISVFDGRSFRILSPGNISLTTRIERVIENSEKKIMFASYGAGVGLLDVDSVHYINVENGLPSNIVKTVFQDREGNYWFGTWNGLCKYKGDRFVNYTHEDGLSNNNILSVASDSAGIIWFGTLTGGVNYMENETIGSLGLESGLKSSTIWSIYFDSQNRGWFGTTNGPALLDRQTMTFSHPYPSFDNMIIYTILEDKHNHLYFGTDRGIYISNAIGGFNHIGEEEGLTDEKVRVLFEDRSGKIWIGTLKNIYFMESQKITNFNEKFNIPEAPVTSIIEDTTGRVLVSTYDFGIYVVGNSVNSEIIRPINTSLGIYSDKILFNYLDRNQHLWLGTSSGLDCINWHTYLNTGNIDLNHYDKSNGYSGVETNAACPDLHGNIWFASVNGAIRHNIRSGIIANVIPIIRISTIQLFLDNVDWQKKQIQLNSRTGLPENMVLGYDNNHITFHFSGIYLTAPEEIKYQYILEGFEKNWSPVTSQNLASYSNLGAGTYTFKVKCSANARTWSNPVTYTFTIKPPYWKTPFFYFLYAATAAGSLFLFLKIRTRAMQRTQNLLMQKVEQRTRELNQKSIEMEKLSLVASETDNAVLIFNDAAEIEWTNTGFTKLTGFSLQELATTKGRRLRDFTFTQEADEFLQEAVSKRQSAIFESRIPGKDQSMIWVSNTLTPIFNEDGFLKKIVVICTDITYRKMMEEKIKQSLDEKGLLLREIHHRVKNNLQIIISLFNLQSHYINDQKAFAALKEGQDRIKSMALIHERFYQNEGLSRIDFDEYIARLVENLFLSFNIQPERISTAVDAEKISLDIDTAVPCGLIINELVSNSLKHGFPGLVKGEIRILFMRVGGDRIQLSVSDNGIGLPEGFHYENSDSLGMQLITALANQLDGTLKQMEGKGTTFTLEFRAT